MGNNEQIWQTCFSLKFGKISRDFSLKFVVSIVGEIEHRIFFDKNFVPTNFRLAKKVW
jgi:hypothetical protein